MSPNPQEFNLTEEILNGKLHFLCSEKGAYSEDCQAPKMELFAKILLHPNAYLLHYKIPETFEQNLLSWENFKLRFKKSQNSFCLYHKGVTHQFSLN